MIVTAPGVVGMPASLASPVFSSCPSRRSSPMKNLSAPTFCLAFNVLLPIICSGLVTVPLKMPFKMLNSASGLPSLLGSSKSLMTPSGTASGDLLASSAIWFANCFRFGLPSGAAMALSYRGTNSMTAARLSAAILLVNTVLRALTATM